MISATLNRLESLFSRQFLIAYAFPTLFFAILNLAIYEIVRPEFVGGAGWSFVAWYAELDASLQAITSLAGIVAFVVVTFVLALLAPLARDVLEGRRLLPEWLKALCREPQRERLWALQERRQALARLENHRLLDAETIRTKIRDARRLANRRQRKRLDATVDPDAFLRVETQLQEIWSESDVSFAICDLWPDLIRALKDAIKCNLAVQKEETELLIDRFNRTAEYLRNRVDEEQITLFNEQNTHFPQDFLAPTRLGNVAAAVRSHVYHVYGMDTDFFWLRLESVLPSDCALRDEIHDAKAKLDAMVLLCFYHVIFTIVWLILLGFHGNSVQLFLLIGVLGPMAAILFYGLAVQSYLVLGDTMRSAVDLHRFELMTALKVKVPESKEMEMQTWKDLQRALAFGEPLDITYEHPGP